AAIRHKRADRLGLSNVHDPVAPVLFSLIQGTINTAQCTFIIRMTIVQGHADAGGNSHALPIHDPKGLSMNAKTQITGSTHRPVRIHVHQHQEKLLAAETKYIITSSGTIAE